MDFALDDELQMLREMARNFAAEKIAPFADEWDERHYLPYDEVIRPMGELGFFGTVIPEEYGGPGLGYLEQAMVLEEFWKVDPGIGQQLSSVTFGAEEVLLFGTEDQKRKWPRRSRCREI